MKKHLSLLILICIVMLYIVGCTNYDNTTEKELYEPTNTSTPSTLTTDWQPSIYDNVNNLDDVIMTIKEETLSPTSLIVAFQNNSNSECAYGEYLHLEKKINGNWYQLPVTIEGNYKFNDISYDLSSEPNSEWTVDWEWLYGSLETGQYRIIIHVNDFKKPKDWESGDYDTYYLAAEFVI